MIKAMFAAGLVATGFAASAAEVQLTKTGVAKAALVVAKDADKAARFGAADLKWHLDHITGADFRIVENSAETMAELKKGRLIPIYLGFQDGVKADRAAFAGQKFRVDVRPDAIELVGLDKEDKGKFAFELDDGGAVVGVPSNWPGVYDRQGTMYAVYEFLARFCGVVWSEPSDAGTYLPKDPDLKVAVRTVDKEPFMAYRGGYRTDDPAFYSSHIDRTVCDEIEFGKARLEAARQHMASRIKHLTAHQKALFMLRHRVGGDYSPANHSLYGWYDRFWEKHPKWGEWTFVAEHKDWFGKYPSNKGRPPQLCYSHPEVVRQLIQDARDYFDKGGYVQHDSKGNVTGYKASWGKDNFCIEPMDGAGYCTCERCTRQYEPERKDDAAEHSTYWFGFVAKVAAEVKKTHPDKKILVLAYSSHEGLPHGVTLPDNVVVYCCLSGNRTLMGKTPDESRQFKRMRAWREAYPNNTLALWLYNGFPSAAYISPGVPGFFASQAQRQYEIFRELDVRGGIFHCGFDGEVDNYMQLEWMVDPTRKAADMLEEYFRPYGKAGPHLRAFYELVEKRYTDPSAYLKGAEFSPKCCWGRMIRDREWAELERLMAAAEDEADTPQAVLLTAAWRRAVFNYMKKGRDIYLVRSAAPSPKLVAARVASAGGDSAKVDWTKPAPFRSKLFWRGGTNETPFAAQTRVAHDGEWLYVELTEFLDAKKLHNAANIVAFDETELQLARQEDIPYREWFSSPDGRVNAASFMEMNMRWCVMSEEHGHPKFGARYTSDTSKGDRWTMRWALPLKAMLDKPVNPGETIYMNATTVLGPHFRPDCGDSYTGDNGLGIATLTSYTSVHSTDRMAEIRLEP